MSNTPNLPTSSTSGSNVPKNTENHSGSKTISAKIITKPSQTPTATEIMTKPNPKKQKSKQTNSTKQ